MAICLFATEGHQEVWSKYVTVHTEDVFIIVMKLFQLQYYTATYKIRFIKIITVKYKYSPKITISLQLPHNAYVWPTKYVYFMP